MLSSTAHENSDQFFLSRMADNSKFTLRWEIDNATARFATGKVESDVFNEGGFKWIAALDLKKSGLKGDLTVRCGVDHNGPWKCEVEMDIRILRNDGRTFVPKADRFCFDETNSVLVKEDRVQDKLALLEDKFLRDDKIVMEFRIHVISSERGHPISALFNAPSRMSNVLLKVGEMKLHVSKEYLAIHSSFFDTLFFGDFAENGQDEVEIKDVVYEEFLDLLQWIYCESMEITDRTVTHILKLADQFQMKRVVNQAEFQLIKSKGIDVVKKLVLADEYRLDSLRDHCLNSFTCAPEMMQKVKSSPECANFSADLKIAIYDLHMKI